MGTRRTKQGAGLKETDALSMIKGKGDNAHTFYSCGVVDAAIEQGVGIRVAKRNSAGDVMETLTKPRRVHRDLLGTFNSPHERAGEGKYVASEAIDDKTITGGQSVCPYLDSDGSYATSIRTFMSRMDKAELAALKATIQHNRVDGTHLKWHGRRSGQTDAVLVSDWLTPAQLWDVARKLTPSLQRQLREQKSQVSGVEEHLDAFSKFCQNLDVMRRARRVFEIATGEINEESGGVTPYAMPLEQCQFAIDRFFLTNHVIEDGTETGDYYYRLAIGRSTPHVLYKRHWVGLDTRCKFAYLTEEIREQAIAAAKAVKAKVAA